MKAVILPKFGFDQVDAQLVRWIKKPGDAVEQGDPIAEVTTDKVNMEIEAPVSGILAGFQAREGDTLPVTSVIAYVLSPGETLPETVAQPISAGPPAPTPGAPGPQPVTPVAARLAAERGLDVRQIAGSGPGGKVTRRDVMAHMAGTAKPRASPAARRSARELGIRLGDVSGSGPRSRIQGEDVRAFAASRPATAPPPAVAEGSGVRLIPLTGMRRTIAVRMQRSAQEAPHITLEADVLASAAEDLRARVEPGGQTKASLTAIIAGVVAWALRRHPLLNTRIDGENILVLPSIHIGIAVALDEGLIVPVVHDADRKSLGQLATEIADLSERARQGRLRPQDVAEGTFTISNLGMFGVDRFTAILNPPQTGILAVGQARKRVVPDEDDRPVVRPVMTLTLSADHRVVDGAVAARFLSDVRQALEAPGIMSL